MPLYPMQGILGNLNRSYTQDSTHLAHAYMSIDGSSHIQILVNLTKFSIYISI